MRVLSVTHGPSVPGGVFEETVERAGHRLERWSVPVGRCAGACVGVRRDLVFGGAMHPDEDARHGWLEPEVEFLRQALGARRSAASASASARS